MSNLATAFVEAARIHPDRTAVRQDDVVLSYAELDARTAAVAGWLAAKGIRAGYRVGVMLPNVAEFAVVLEPDFVVLDEPTSALDMLFQAQMVDLLRELQRKRDLTYMFISHDLRVVASLASHLIVMRHGKVVEEGPAAELFKNPKSDYTRALFAAAFRIEAVPGDAAAT